MNGAKKDIGLFGEKKKNDKLTDTNRLGCRALLHMHLVAAVRKNIVQTENGAGLFSPICHGWGYGRVFLVVLENKATLYTVSLVFLGVVCKVIIIGLQLYKH